MRRFCAAELSQSAIELNFRTAWHKSSVSRAAISY
jgi:hypothetical protein